MHIPMDDMRDYSDGNTNTNSTVESMHVQRGRIKLFNSKTKQK